MEDEEEAVTSGSLLIILRGQHASSLQLVHRLVHKSIIVFIMQLLGIFTLFVLGGVVGVVQPMVGNTSIVFPNPDIAFGHRNRGGGGGVRSQHSNARVPHRKPPLHILRAIGGGVDHDYVKVVKELVSNVKVESNVMTGEFFLVDKDGRPIHDKKGNTFLEDFWGEGFEIFFFIFYRQKGPGGWGHSAQNEDDHDRPPWRGGSLKWSWKRFIHSKD